MRERFERPNTIADIVNNRLVSFRAFRHDGMMIYDANRIGEGGNYDDVRPERCCLHQCTYCQSRLHALPDRASLMFRKSALLPALPDFEDRTMTPTAEEVSP